jgi:adenine-specific DNA-methyltransferase
MPVLTQRIKDLSRTDRPREKMKLRGPESLSNSELLAIMLGSGIKGANVKQVARKLVNRYGTDLINTTQKDLEKIEGIGPVKANQLVAVFNLAKRYLVQNKDVVLIRSADDVFRECREIRQAKQEHLIALYLDSLNHLIKKQTITIGTINANLIHPREIFAPAMELRVNSVILVHNHPAGDLAPSDNDIKITKKIVAGGSLLDIPVIDHIIISKDGFISLLKHYSGAKVDYLKQADTQLTLFNIFDLSTPGYTSTTHPVTILSKKPFGERGGRQGLLQIQSRRYLGNKFKLLNFIKEIVEKRCKGYKSFCDIFAGTGVVGNEFNDSNIKIISNESLYSNYVSLCAWLYPAQFDGEKVVEYIDALNRICPSQENYVSEHFGGTYFTIENARKIGAIREKIEELSLNFKEKCILLTSLLYAIDKVANTCGHYDAFRRILDTVTPIKLLVPDIRQDKSRQNEIYNEDANNLIRRIKMDILYIDPPYNSRHYCDNYHLLENIVTWKKPRVFGVANKMLRSSLKSQYCLKTAPRAFEDLISSANCRYILVSYNNMAEKGNHRSNARIKDKEIIRILSKKGKTEIFETEFKSFTAGKSKIEGHTERLFFCEVLKEQI